MATHPGILAWEIPRTEGLGGQQSSGHQESDTADWPQTGRSLLLEISWSSVSLLLIIDCPYRFNSSYLGPDYSHSSTNAGGTPSYRSPGPRAISRAEIYLYSLDFLNTLSPHIYS